ncbi:hypothetical protein CMI47_21685 [Candidatus Pacearchaeota archaeon]|nr:hypothetical protein [Candidatus Pacearchaeota archaeon]|tara:strand:+ start:770 stop:2188 length:1419 start_codon:yes stop_codon:yes gene_type:complete
MSKNWSSFENDRLIMESWRKHLSEEPVQVDEFLGLGKSREDKWARIAQGDERPGDMPAEKPAEGNPYGQGKLDGIVKGLTFLNQSQQLQLLTMMNNIAQDDGIVLEVATLSGDRSEGDRVISPENSRQLMNLIASFNLEQAESRKIMMALNQWGKMNTVKFSTPTAVTQTQPTTQPQTAASPTPPGVTPPQPEEPTPGPAEPTPEPAEPTPEPEEPSPEPGEPTEEPEDDVLPIAASELKLIQQIAKNKDADLFDIVKKTFAALGSTLRNPEVVPIVKTFNKEFFPKLATMHKRANIPVAEGRDLQALLEAYGAEEATREPLSKGQQAYRKGKRRGKKSATGYFKSLGGKPPYIVRKLKKNLEAALLADVTADELLNAAAEVSDGMRDAKEKNEFDDNVLNQLSSNPEGRLQRYKENAAELLDLIVKMAMDALSKAGPAKRASKLPENNNEGVETLAESKELARWKLIAGIK